MLLGPRAARAAPHPEWVVAQRGERGEGEQIEATAAGEDSQDRQGVGGALRADHQQLAQVHPAGDERRGLGAILRIDERDQAVLALRGGDGGEEEARLAGGLDAEQLGQATAREAARPERQVEAERARGDGRRVGARAVLPQSAYNAGSEAPLDRDERLRDPPLARPPPLSWAIASPLLRDQTDAAAVSPWHDHPII